MKKLLSCILVLALFLSLSLAAGWGGRALADTPEDRVGTYTITNIVIDGEDYSDLIKQSGVQITLVLNADGTAVLNSDGEILELTWDEKCFTADDGVPVPYTFEDGVIVMSEEDTVMTFAKVDDPEAAVEKAGEAGSVVGSWFGTMEIRDSLVEEDPSLEAYIGQIPMYISMELRENGTYSMILDTTMLIPGLRNALFSYFGDLCEEKGITIEQLEESYGKSLEEIVEESLAEIDQDDLLVQVEGSYEASNGKIVWDEGDNETVGMYTGDTLFFDVPGFGENVLTRCSAVGTWTASINMMDMAGEDDGELGQYFANVNVDLVLETRSDNSYQISMDSSTVLPAMKVAMTAYLEDMLAEEGMTVEQLEAVTGMTMEDLIADAMESLDLSEMDKSLTGTYTEKDGEIAVKTADGEENKGTWNGSSLTLNIEDFGELSFKRISNEDILAKGEGVMTYAEYAAAELDSPVVIEAYVQDHQSWYKDAITVYAQDADGAYFIYNMACSEEDAALLVPGQKIRVSGFKSEWAGEVEIVDATFEFVRGSYVFRPLNVTGLLGSDDLIQYQNRKVSFKGMTVEPYDDTGAAFAYKDPDGKTDDLYFKVSKDGKTYEFCVEFYLCGKDTPVYRAVEALNVGDTVDLEGFLYWYEGPNPHITSVSFR